MSKVAIADQVWTAQSGLRNAQKGWFRNTVSTRSRQHNCKPSMRSKCHEAMVNAVRGQKADRLQGLKASKANVMVVTGRK
jgi:hypothetical protein